jgi:hypothetical protein
MTRLNRDFDNETNDRAQPMQVADILSNRIKVYLVLHKLTVNTIFTNSPNHFHVYVMAFYDIDLF